MKVELGSKVLYNFIYVMVISIFHVSSEDFSGNHSRLGNEPFNVPESQRMDLTY